jgi:hypothetical protein
MLLISASKSDYTSGIKINNVINASIKTLKTETLILLKEIMRKIEEEKRNYISEDKE